VIELFPLPLRERVRVRGNIILPLPLCPPLHEMERGLGGEVSMPMGKKLLLLFEEVLKIKWGELGVEKGSSDTTNV
jgi:hypothetical protein